VIPGLLGFGELESLEVVERGSGSSGDDALVKSVFLPLVVDLSGGPGLANGASAGTVSDRDLVLEEAHMLEHHRLARDTWTIDESALLVNDIDDGNESVLEGSDADVGDTANLDEVVEDTDSHFELSFNWMELIPN